jgi:hypothetical protein
MKEDNTTIDPTWMQRTGGFARDMTLRDWYAGLALQGRVANAASFVKWNSQKAYEFADAMLKARDGK